MKKYGLILTAFLSLVITSCTFQDVEVGNISGVNLLSTSKEGVDLEVSIPVNNPNKMGFTISKVNIELSIGGVDFGKVSQVKSIHVKPQSNEVYPILFHIRFKETFQGLPKLMTAMMMGKKVDMKAKGYIKGRKFIFSKKFHIDESTNVNLFNKLKLL